MDRIVEQDELMKLTKARQKNSLRRRLKEAHIRYHETGGNIWTTLEAINAALVGREKTKKREPAFDAIAAKGPR